MPQDAEMTRSLYELVDRVKADPEKASEPLSQLTAFCRTKAAAAVCGAAFENRDGLYAALRSDFPKTRKNAARLLGALGQKQDEEALLSALKEEKTCFVVPSIVLALGSCGTERAAGILEVYEFPGQDLPENEKHRTETERAIAKALDSLTETSFPVVRKLPAPRSMLLVSPEGFSDVLCEELAELAIPNKPHEKGAVIKTDDLERVFLARCFTELLFPIKKNVPLDAESIAGAVQKELNLPYRVELRDYEGDRRTFIENIVSRIKAKNSPSHYALELRILCEKDVCRLYIKPYNVPDRRFVYRKKALPASIQPALAACIVRYAARYLPEDKENSLVLDACCGSGTLLLERELFAPAKSIQGVDISGTAIDAAKENAAAAGSMARFICKDMAKFIPKAPVDEIYMNLPFGNRVGNHENNKALYRALADALPGWLKPGGIAVLYTMEYELLDRCLKRKKEITCINSRRTAAGGLLPWMFILKKNA